MITIVGYTKKILMWYVSTIEEWAKKPVISYEIKTLLGYVQNQFPSPTLRIYDRLISKLWKVVGKWGCQILY